MIPGGPAICEGTVVHRRRTPVEHAFTYPVSYAWLDPDAPEALCDPHWAWSHRRPAPARFRRRDYGTSPTGSLGAAARTDLAPVLGYEPDGEVRMLTQLRRWGWLFNPITIYLVWNDRSDPSRGARTAPVGAVVEVTNTPWNQRIRYPVALAASAGLLSAGFDKRMHVSPFLAMDYGYGLRIGDRDDALEVDVDVVDRDDGGSTVLSTALRVSRVPATTETLGRSLRDRGPTTHRVSLGIHRQAARLWRKGVRFVPHPDRTRRPLDDSAGTGQEAR